MVCLFPSELNLQCGNSYLTTWLCPLLSERLQVALQATFISSPGSQSANPSYEVIVSELFGITALLGDELQRAGNSSGEYGSPESGASADKLGAGELLSTFAKLLVSFAECILPSKHYIKNAAYYRPLLHNFFACFSQFFDCLQRCTNRILVPSKPKVSFSLLHTLRLTALWIRKWTQQTCWQTQLSLIHFVADLPRSCILKLFCKGMRFPRGQCDWFVSPILTADLKVYTCKTSGRESYGAA